MSRNNLIRWLVPCISVAVFVAVLTGAAVRYRLYGSQGRRSRHAARGVPVVGMNSLRYFWGERTPRATTHDVSRVLRHYLAQWQASEILLIGYSFGADVMPFIINRLPPDLRARVVSATLLSLSKTASFEVHMADWMGAATTDGRPTLPELQSIKDVPLLCVAGAGDEEAACNDFTAPTYSAQSIGEGHHFSGRFAEIADRLLAFAAR